jgi:hypothetical protein
MATSTTELTSAGNVPKPARLAKEQQTRASFAKTPVRLRTACLASVVSRTVPPATTESARLASLPSSLAPLEIVLPAILRALLVKSRPLNVQAVQQAVTCTATTTVGSAQKQAFSSQTCFALRATNLVSPAKRRLLYALHAPRSSP